MNEQALKELLARQAIRDAINRYCRGEDRLDAQLSLSLWHPDGTATYGINGEFYNGPVTGWAERSHTVLRQWTGSSHQVTNVIIEVDGQPGSVRGEAGSLEKILASAGALAVRKATTPEACEKLWGVGNKH